MPQATVAKWKNRLVLATVLGGIIVLAAGILVASQISAKANASLTPSKNQVPAQHSQAKGTAMSEITQLSLEGAWRLTHAEGLLLTDDAPVQFNIRDGVGEFSGLCEPFFGDVVHSDGIIAIGPFGSSREADCLPDERKKQAELKDLLMRVSSYEISETGELSLLGGPNENLRAVRP